MSCKTLCAFVEYNLFPLYKQYRDKRANSTPAEGCVAKMRQIDFSIRNSISRRWRLGRPSLIPLPPDVSSTTGWQWKNIGGQSTSEAERHRADKCVLLQAHRPSFTHSVCFSVIREETKHLLLQRKPNKKPTFVHRFFVPTRPAQNKADLLQNGMNPPIPQPVPPSEINLPNPSEDQILSAHHPNMPPPAATNTPRRIPPCDTICRPFRASGQGSWVGLVK